MIVGPDGTVLAGPVREQETILTTEVDLDLVRAARRQFDAAGHYHRPDIFRLCVDTAARPSVMPLAQQAFSHAEPADRTGERLVSAEPLRSACVA